MPFFIRMDRLWKRIDPLNVMVLESNGNYVRIYLSDGTQYDVRSTLKAALKKLSPEIFIQTHRTTIASVFYIDDILEDHLVIGGHPVPIGDEFYDAFIKKLHFIGEGPQKKE